MKTNHLLLLLLTLGLAANVLLAAPPQIPLTVTVEGDGTVMRVPAGTECPADCTATYKKGTTVILTATANTSSTFLGWSGACAGNDLTCELRVFAPTDVVAEFVPEVTPQAFPATGQTSCWDIDRVPMPCEGTGQDGEIQAGSPLSYTDTELTVIDNNTKLEWMKQDDNDTLNPLACNSYPGNLDKDCRFSWYDAFAFVASLNANNHAGHNDWRMPNIKELLSIVNFENVVPAVSAEFNTGCVAGCTVDVCSCTTDRAYWSSTSDQSYPFDAWHVDFDIGDVSNSTKDIIVTNIIGPRVRAVRGGL